MRKVIKNNVSWVGWIDWELKTFHGDEYSIKNGSSQNAYLIEEEKTVLVDTVWSPHRDEFVENLRSELGGDLGRIDCIVVNHGEQDHSGALPSLLKEIPGTPIYCTSAAVQSLEGQYGRNGWNFNVVKIGDSLDIGNGKKLIFIEMKMLHWPDSMATYMTLDNILFSMDAFGQHFAVEELFNDRADQALLFREAMKYFANILSPFASFVTRKLDEIARLNLPIDIIAPSHGVVWRDHPEEIIRKYGEWADGYQENQVTVLYDTMWNGTKALAYAVADEIHRFRPDTAVKVYNIAQTDKNDLMTEVFRSRAVAVGSPTCLNGVLTSVSAFLSYAGALKFRNKKAAAFGCYGWSGESVSLRKERLAAAGFDVVDACVRSHWNPDEEDYAGIPEMVSELLGEDQCDKQAESRGSRVYVCEICGWQYDEAEGDPDNGILGGTKWENLPEEFHCPLCHAPKECFSEQ